MGFGLRAMYSHGRALSKKARDFKNLAMAAMGSRTVGGRGRDDRKLLGGQGCVHLGRDWG